MRTKLTSYQCFDCGLIQKDVSYIDDEGAEVITPPKKCSCGCVEFIAYVGVMVRVDRGIKDINVTFNVTDKEGK